MGEIRVIWPWVPACETGRHIPPHPGDSCDDVDRFIAARDQIFSEMIRASAEHLDRELRELPLLGTVFATPSEPPPGSPGRIEVQRALDTLRPHLAWDHRYRA